MSDWPTHHQAWVSRWQQVSFPVFRETKERLSALLPGAESVRPAQVAAIVLEDPYFAVQVLRAINGMPRGRYSAPVLLLENAVLLMGVRRFITQFSALPVLEDSYPSGHPVRQGLQLLARRARAASGIAREWAKLRVDARIEEPQMAALFCTLQDALLLLDAPLQKALHQGISGARQVREQLLGEWRGPLMAELLSAWRLPEIVGELLAQRLTASARAQCLHDALQLAAGLDAGWYSPTVRDALQRTVDTLKVDAAVLWSSVVRVLLQDSADHAAELEPLACMLPLIPSDPEVETPVVTAQPAPPPAPPVESPLDLAIKRFIALPETAQTAEVMGALFRLLQDDLHCTRLVLFLASPTKDRLVARHAVGAADMARLEIPLAGEHLLARLMGKTQTLWLNQENTGRLFPMLLPDERKLLGPGDWFAGSLCAHGVPLGLIFADRGAGGRFDSPYYRGFQRLTQETARRLALLSAPPAKN